MHDNFDIKSHQIFYDQVCYETKVCDSPTQNEGSFFFDVDFEAWLCIQPIQCLSKFFLS